LLNCKIKISLAILTVKIKNCGQKNNTSGRNILKFSLKHVIFARIPEKFCVITKKYPRMLANMIFQRKKSRNFLFLPGTEEILRFSEGFCSLSLKFAGFFYLRSSSAKIVFVLFGARREESA